MDEEEVKKENEKIGVLKPEYDCEDWYAGMYEEADDRE